MAKSFNGISLSNAIGGAPAVTRPTSTGAPSKPTSPASLYAISSTSPLPALVQRGGADSQGPYGIQIPSNPSVLWVPKLGSSYVPGSIPIGGMKGFKRETGWDIRKGKGTAGAVLVRKTMPPVEGTVTTQLYSTQDFADWDAFVEASLSIDSGTQAANGIPWNYPGHGSIGLMRVVIKYFTGPEPVGKGMYHASFGVIEWFPPPQNTSIAYTVPAAVTLAPPVGSGPVNTGTGGPAAQASQGQAAGAGAGQAAGAGYAPPVTRP